MGQVMNKPAFNPDEPFEGSGSPAKPAFDPNAAFAPVQQAPAPPVAATSGWDAMTAGGGAIPRAALKQAWNMTPISHPIDNLPVLGATLGGGVGAAGGEALREAIHVGMGQPAPTPGQTFGRVFGQGMLAGVPETPQFKNAVQGVARGFGRRALGILKPVLDKIKGGVGRADQAAQDMLDQGVIAPGRGAVATKAAAEGVEATTGQAVGDALASTGQHALDTNQVSQQVIDQLVPKLKGGAYDAQEKISKEILDTIGAHGKGPIDFKSAQQLKSTLKQMAGDNWNTDKLKAAMYQKTYGIVSKALEDSVEASSAKLPVVADLAKTGKPTAVFDYNDPITKQSSYKIQGDPALHGYKTTPNVPYGTLQQKGIPVVGQTQKAVGLGHTPLDKLPSPISDSYLKNKQLYGSTQIALTGLTDKVNREATNSLLSLRGAAIGAGALASGNVLQALEAVGAWEAAKRVGAGTVASLLNSANSAALDPVRRAAMAAFIDKFTTKNNQQETQ